MKEYIFSVYYFGGESCLIKVMSSTRAKAYEKVRAKAIKLKNDLDFVELN
jgi:hypothetical protein